mgnify:FL=1
MLKNNYNGKQERIKESKRCKIAEVHIHQGMKVDKLEINIMGKVWQGFFSFSLKTIMELSKVGLLIFSRNRLKKIKIVNMEL